MNPDVAQAGDNALVHYLEYGIHEGRYPNNVYELWIRKHRLTDADRKRILDHIQIFFLSADIFPDCPRLQYE